VALEVYWASGSAPAWRVLLALALKGVAYDSRPVRLTRKEQRSAWFLAINPRGKVPVIRDGGLTLTESLAILVYLDRKHPEPPLFGETAEEAGVIQRWIGEHDAWMWPPLLGLVRPVLYGAPGAVKEKEGEIRAAAGKIGEELGRLEVALGATAYLAGARVSAADVVWFPSVQLVARAAARAEVGLGEIAERFPAVAAWCARIEAVPGIYPPGW
jgi:glutathione S-transferase